MGEVTFLGTSQSEFSLNSDHYLRGLKYSPSGDQILSNSNDNVLRLFNTITEPTCDDILPELCLNLSIPVYDFCWHPNSQSFATSSRRTSVLLWSANDCSNICSYPIKNNVDEIHGPYSLQFDSDGQFLFCGFDKCLKIVNLSRPNDVPVKRCLKNRNSTVSQSGIISSIAMAPQMYALSCYNGTIGLYDLKAGLPISIMSGCHDSDGITSVKFTDDHNYLVSVARKDTKICIWDLRQISMPLIKILPRNSSTNQKIDVDVRGSFLFTGGLDGAILVYDLAKLDLEPWVVPAHLDCCNSVSCHPTESGSIVSGSGQRHYLNTVMDCSSSSSDEDSSLDDVDRGFKSGVKGSKVVVENCIKFWKLSI